jgi:ATP-dependent DNA helicase RecQ
MPLQSQPLESLQSAVLRHWGFNSFRPLQQEAMQAVLQGRDSLLVLPTGGGKSLCYQAPAVVRGDTTVVVSPLISLMKDQVDSLRACGVPAVQINSGQSDEDREMATYEAIQGNVRLLFVAPERIVQPGFQALLKRISVQRFAIDEAHCISHWGHDFRPEYRELKQLKTLFPEASVHGYTATATQRVRKDVVAQLGLKNPAVLVGNFDRPNLTYRILPRVDLRRQVREVIERHRNEAGIIYCIRRKDVDALAEDLRSRGLPALPYHAGMEPHERKMVQDAFAAEECNLIVATVAFGMGIDRSNIRFVLHAAMPKSVEHYQQETGRAGRDGLEAECVLLYSAADTMSWKGLVEKSAAEAQASREYIASALQHVDEMDRYCRGAVCRHRALVNYFGQQYEPENCQACDHCLGDTEPVADALTIAQKILSCVARVKERFGAGQVISVLRGENTEKVRANQHDQLSTFGLLREHSPADIRNWVYQLVGQHVLVQTTDQYPILRLNEASWEVMRGTRTVRLLQPVKKEKLKASKADAVSWEGVDRPLFEAMRELRQRLATEKHVPPYVIFSDATLRELARVRPSSLAKMKLLYGIGDAKLSEFGARFLAIVDEQVKDRHLSQDQSHAPPAAPIAARSSIQPNPQRQLAFKLFAQGANLEDIIHQTGRARATVLDYLAEHIRSTRPESINAWIDKSTYDRIAAAARKVGFGRMKPIFVELGERVPYDEIRLVVAHLQAHERPVDERPR